MNSCIVRKNMKKIRVTLAVALVNPKYPHTVGAAVWAASRFGVEQVWFTGNRVSMISSKGYCLSSTDVSLLQNDYFFDQYTKGDIVPVAVELRKNREMLPREMLPYFVHPDNAIYLFGPEDGSLSHVHLQHCHRFVVIPIRHCANLAAAVYMVLYDRMMKSCCLPKLA